MVSTTTIDGPGGGPDPKAIEALETEGKRFRDHLERLRSRGFKDPESILDKTFLKATEGVYCEGRDAKWVRDKFSPLALKHAGIDASRSRKARERMHRRCALEAGDGHKWHRPEAPTEGAAEGDASLRGHGRKGGR